MKTYTLSISEAKEPLDIPQVNIAYQRPPFSSLTKITNSQEVNDLMRLHFSQETICYKEQFLVLLLSYSNHVLGVSKVSQGDTASIAVHVSEILQLCLLSNASFFMVAHNHPSGNLKPSKADIRLTNQLAEAGQILKVKLIDHLIITQEDYLSFADEDLMPTSDYAAGAQLCH
jgi:DNA repair protein RadC